MLCAVQLGVDVLHISEVVRVALWIAPEFMKTYNTGDMATFRLKWLISCAGPSAFGYKGHKFKLCDITRAHQWFSRCYNDLHKKL